MATQRTALVAVGLDLVTSELQRKPGSLDVAQNVRMRNYGMIQPRRGYEYVGLGIAEPAGTNGFFGYKDTIFQVASDQLYRFQPGDVDWTFVTLGVKNEEFTRAAESRGSVFFTTFFGVLRLDTVTGLPQEAGALKAIGFSSTATVTTGASGFLANGFQAAYRYTLFDTDANEIRREGVPSGRLNVRNISGGTRNVSVRVELPREATVEHTITVYRSAQTPNAVEPSDELQRVYEYKLKPADITNGFYVFTDTVTDDLRDALLYTSPSQEGILQANENPPYATDVATFGGCLTLTGLAYPHRFFLDILAVGGTDGIQINDTIIIGSVTYTAVAAPAAPTEYKLETGLGSAALNNRATAYNLATTVNQKTNVANVLQYAYYISGPDDFLGKLLIESRINLNIAPHINGFSVYVGATSKFACFNPQLTQGLTAVTPASTSETLPNAVAFSKSGQPFSFPTLNRTQPLGAGEPTTVIRPTRDSLFILKPDGVWRMTGNGEQGFTITELDRTTGCIYPRTADVTDNEVYFVAVEGVMKASESGVSLISHPIEPALEAIIPANLPAFPKSLFGVAYQSEHEYHLWVNTDPQPSSPTNAATRHVYSTIYKCWVSFDSVQGSEESGVAAAFVGPGDGKMWLANNNITNGLILTYRELKSFTIFDFADFGTSIAMDVRFALSQIGEPGRAKHIKEVIIHFAQGFGLPSGLITLTAITDATSSAFLIGPAKDTRFLVPRECRRGERMAVELAYLAADTDVRLLGIEILYSDYSPRVSK